MFTSIIVVAWMLLLGVTFDSCVADSWHYPTPGPDGSIGQPEHWGGSCDVGKRQSPIEINHKAAVKGTYPDFFFVNYDVPLTNASLVNTGHTVQIMLGDSSTSIYGGGLREKYILEQLHFHWSSEHTIDDTRYALEMHLVHHSSKYNSVAEASTTKAGVAVLAVLFHVSEKSNDAIETILNSTDPVKEKVDDQVQLVEELELNKLLPKNRKVYFRYDGSLTTPVCAESVVWTVFPESLPISLAQVEDFKTIRDSDNEVLILNYRPVQPLNARVLVHVSDTEFVESGSVHIRYSISALVICALLSNVIFNFSCR